MSRVDSLQIGVRGSEEGWYSRLTDFCITQLHTRDEYRRRVSGGGGVSHGQGTPVEIRVHTQAVDPTSDGEELGSTVVIRDVRYLNSLQGYLAHEKL